MICPFCHQKLSGTIIHFRDECHACGRDLHVCLNCEFYDENAYRQCRESITELVQNKDRANYCDFFRPAKDISASSSAAEDPMSKLNRLFKK